MGSERFLRGPKVLIARIQTSVIVGIDALPVEVEVDLSSGLPAFTIVGLPDAVCRESQVRVRSAIKNSGFQFPARKISVSLAPADLKKEGTGFDLPIAVGILAATGQIDYEKLKECVFAGELSLDGKLRPITGILSRVAALIRSGKKIVFPHGNLREAACFGEVRLHPVRTLCEAVSAFQHVEWHGTCQTNVARNSKKSLFDFCEVKGQILARRGIEIACAGAHNLLMIGPPGSGKTMLAQRIPTVLSELTFEEAVETTKIHSVASQLRRKDSLVRIPPFRKPHHTISDIAMVGGGSYPRPGEISLAHNGVLFLDELPEFRRNVLECLRQPLEEGRISVSRASLCLSFPSQFMLVAAMNPCPCGYFTDPRHECQCTPLQIKNYIGRISGPLLDRIDIHLYVGSLRSHDFKPETQGEASEEIKQRVERARKRQKQRFREPRMLNSRLEGKKTEAYCVLSDEAGLFLRKALEEIAFSGRAYHKVLKIARTIADLDDKPLIELIHIQEAVQYRSLDRQWWS